MKFDEVEMRHKAGIIPYIHGEDGIKMLFMKPSNPKFGGSQFQIAKGNLDPGEDTLSAAIREGTEELGLVTTNIAKLSKLTTQRLTGQDETYIITVYAAEVKDESNFTLPHYETSDTKWMLMDEFRAVGRLSQVSIVQQLAN
jgi:8-oxo-dGTP pyrophosphatase MutT (NUDIX family)